MNKKNSIRMSGLGGQGVVTAAHILGVAATRDGLVSTVNPFFGAEKRLAPAESYVRISPSRIFERGEILYPDLIMIFHPHVISLGKCYTMPFFAGLLPGGLILINGDSAPELSQDEWNSLKTLKAKLYYFPATKVALEVGGTELATNMAMLGALTEITNIVSWKCLTDALAERFGGGKFIASATTAALDDALKSKYDKLSQLLEQNIAVMKAAGAKIKEVTY